MAYAGNHPLPKGIREEKQVSRLLTKHAELEAELHQKTNALLVDWDGVKLIKRRKLEVAEQLEALRRTLN